MGPRCSAFGHAGYSGANGFADPKYRFAFAYTKNLLGLQNNPLNQLQIANQIRNLLGIPGCC